MQPHRQGATARSDLVYDRHDRCLGAGGPTAVLGGGLLIPVLDAGDGANGGNAGTPYLGGYNNYQIPQGTGTTQATAGYFSIALADATRSQPAIIATQFLSGQPWLLAVALHSAYCVSRCLQCMHAHTYPHIHTLVHACIHTYMYLYTCIRTSL